MLASNSEDEDYSDDNYDENDFDDAADDEADKKLENLRKALKRENVTAAKVVTKHNIQVNKEAVKPSLKMGPVIKGNITMAQITKDVASMDPGQLIMPQ